ncbi:hypothetical protein ACFE04_025755 [Oxalis oulophora]
MATYLVLLRTVSSIGCWRDQDVLVIVVVVILVILFAMQHQGTDKVSWLFAPVVLLWFLIIGGIGLFNVWKYDSKILKAFSHDQNKWWAARERMRAGELCNGQN